VTVKSLFEANYEQFKEMEITQKSIRGWLKDLAEMQVFVVV
jgi:hypothetical protein